MMEYLLGQLIFWLMAGCFVSLMVLFLFFMNYIAKKIILYKMKNEDNILAKQRFKLQKKIDAIIQKNKNLIEDYTLDIKWK